LRQADDRLEIEIDTIVFERAADRFQHLLVVGTGRAGDDVARVVVDLLLILDLVGSTSLARSAIDVARR